MKMKLAVATLALCGLMVGLAACSEEESSLTGTSTHSTKKVAVKPGRYDLIYLDQNTDGSELYSEDGSTPRSAIGIVVNGKAAEFTIKASHVDEHVALKYTTKPYAKVKSGDFGDDVSIYRGPYTQYVQPEASGTVKSK